MRGPRNAWPACWLSPSTMLGFLSKLGKQGKLGEKNQRALLAAATGDCVHQSGLDQRQGHEESHLVRGSGKGLGLTERWEPGDRVCEASGSASWPGDTDSAGQAVGKGN